VKVSNAELDARILARCEARWLKVARVIYQVMEGTELAEKEWGGQAVAKRLRVLTRKRQLETVGNPWNWRASEVRLPPVGPGRG
jgi:hypothetical protein